MLTPLANAFSILDVDVEDDGEEVATATASLAITEYVKEGKGDSRSGKGRKVESKVENDEVVVQRVTAAEKNVLTQERSPSSGQLKLPLVWIDLEMTGLDLEIDRVLEIACIITDGKLAQIIEGPNLVINQSKNCLDNMNDWCQEHHAASGLKERVLQSKITEKEAEEQVIEFVRKHVGPYTPLLAGNSVYVDLAFLKKYMPNLASLFNHVLVDVSSVNVLCTRWFPGVFKKKPLKKKTHRALDDIRESIQELKYFKENIFIRSKK